MYSYMYVLIDRADAADLRTKLTKAESKIRHGEIEVMKLRERLEKQQVQSLVNLVFWSGYIRLGLVESIYFVLYEYILEYK